MKFGIFIFGDNHPELGRSNLKYYERYLRYRHGELRRRADAGGAENYGDHVQ